MMAVTLALLPSPTVSATPLPCEEPTGDCVAQLHQLAIANSQIWELQGDAIDLRRRTLWTEGMPRVSVGQNLIADDFGDGVSVAVSLDLVEVFGGGERARAQLAIANLEADREAFSTALRLEIARQLTAIAEESAALRSLQARAQTREVSAQLYEISYRTGAGDTVEYFQLQDERLSVGRDVCTAANQLNLVRLELVALVAPEELGAVQWWDCE